MVDSVNMLGTGAATASPMGQQGQNEMAPAAGAPVEENEKKPLRIDAARARFDVAQKNFREMDLINSALEKLSEKGDMIEQEDVIKAASKLVAKGIEADSMASLLSTMPEKGEAIAGWLGQLSDFAAQQEVYLKEEMKEARFQLGVIGMRGLMINDRLDQMDSAMGVGQTAEEPNAMGAAPQQGQEEEAENPARM